jgi:spermidine/putrescine transport system permease protein
VAGAAVVFAVSIDDFVISQWLSSGGDTDTVPIRIYSAARAAPLPSTNAIATVMLIVTLLSLIFAFVTWRFFTRGERRAGAELGRDLGAFN